MLGREQNDKNKHLQMFEKNARTKNWKRREREVQRLVMK